MHWRLKYPFFSADHVQSRQWLSSLPYTAMPMFLNSELCIGSCLQGYSILIFSAELTNKVSHLAPFVLLAIHYIKLYQNLQTDSITWWYIWKWGSWWPGQNRKIRNWGWNENSWGYWHPITEIIAEINGQRSSDIKVSWKITSTIMRLWMAHTAEMTISRDGTKIYSHCKMCQDQALTSVHDFECNIVRRMKLFRLDTLDQALTKDLVWVTKFILELYDLIWLSQDKKTTTTVVFISHGSLNY